MPDVFTKTKRSAVMSRIRSRGNRETELALASLFRRQGITGWRRHVELRVTSGERRSSLRVGGLRNSKLITRHFRVCPDFVFREIKLAVFVDGCFWHGCPRHSPPARWLRRSAMPTVARRDAKAPRTGKRFWRDKLATNRARDRLVTRTLRRAGWRVLRIWEHELAERGVRNAERGTKTAKQGARGAERRTAGLVAKLRWWMR
jgi:DNA mismatch endonuclease, patch repair protein